MPRSSFESLYIEAVCRAYVAARELAAALQPFWRRAEAAAKLGSSKLQRCLAGKALTGEATANVAAGPSSLLGFVLAVLAEDGYGLG